jgi:NADH dehydrogenase
MVTVVMDTGLDVVTGAFSYTGSAIAGHLLDEGRRVRTLTGHPDRPSPLAGRVDVAPYAFEDPDALTRSLEGTSTVYNTYWVRFDRGDVSFDRAIENSKTLFRAAREAGVRRLVHLSVTKPSLDSRFPYFRGKALVEHALAESGLSHAVVRPSIVFGRGDILMNNIAWLLRRLPVFAIPGDGRYRVRPVYVGDVAKICVEAAQLSEDDLTIDAVGPETMTFKEMVIHIRAAAGSRSRIVHVPVSVARVVAGGIGLAVRDVLVSDHELGGLMSELACTDGPTTGETGFSDWVETEGDGLGLRYASEIDRHFHRGRRSPR